jgi:hypothetical protein
VSITAARLQAEVGADTKQFDSGMSHADQRIQQAPSKWATSLKVGAGAALAVGGALVIKGVVGAISSGLTALREDQVVAAQTTAVIRSTGGAAHVTAAQIDALATSIQNTKAVEDQVVAADANLLLTFRAVRNEAGAGNDIFNQSVAVFEDMKRAMPSSSMVQFGKALNDPLKGLTALTKVGVTFDATQTKRIKQFMKEGKVVEAQKVILAEMNKEFKHSGDLYNATDAGQAEQFAFAVEDVQKALAHGLMPAITSVRGALRDFLANPATLSQVGALGDSIASIFSEGNIKTAASVMTTAAGAIGTAIKLFASLPPQVQALAVGALAVKKVTGIGVTDVVGSALKGMNLFQRGGTPANPLYVADTTGALGGGAGLAGGATSMWSKVGKLIGGAFAIVAVAELADAIYPMIAAGGGYQNRVNTGNTLPGDQLSWPWGPKNTPKVDFDLGPFHMANVLGGGSGVPKPGATGSDIGPGSTWAGGHGKQLTATPDPTGLSGRISTALKSTKLSVNAAEMATPLVSAFEQSISPSQRSMSNAMTQLKDMQATYLRQGDTALAASIGRDIAILNQTILNKTWTMAMSIVGSDWYSQPKPKAKATPAPYHPPLVQPKQSPVAVVLSPRLVPNSSRSSSLYGPVNVRNGRAVA